MADLRNIINGNDPRAVANAIRDIGLFLDQPLAGVRITGELATTSPRKVTLQVVDRLGAAKPGRWWVRFTVGDTEWTSSATQTIAVTSSLQAITVTADEVYDVLTNADGIAEFNITGAADTYYVSAIVLGGGGQAVSAAIVVT